eukprot:475649-Pelagomonas_calceolata.AAC.1
MRIWRVGCHALGRPDFSSPALLCRATSKPSPRRPPEMKSCCVGKERKGKGYIAVLAYEDSLAEA